LATATTGPAPALLEKGGSAPEGPTFLDLIATPSGFMAVAGEGTVLVRGSADGSRWERLDAATTFGGPIDDVVAGPAGWIVAQRVETGSDVGVGTVLWHSTDGHAWAELPDQAALRASFSGTLTAGPWGYAMAGQVIDASGTSVPEAWTSRDGRSWQHSDPSGGLGTSQLQLLVTSSGVIAILGEGSLAVTTSGATWSKPLEDRRLVNALIGLAPDRGSLVATTVIEAGLAVWDLDVDTATPAPRIRWHGLDVPGRQGSGATGFASGERGAILLGYDLATLAPRTWLTGDGRTWQRMDLDAGTFGGGIPMAVAVGATAFVTLGWESSTNGAIRGQPWVSLDGRTWSGVGTDAFGDLTAAPAPECPPKAPADVADLAEIAGTDNPDAGAAWLACFGSRTLTLEGWAQGCNECGGTDTAIGIPGWLMDPGGYAPFWLADAADLEGSTLRLGVRIDPDRPVSVPRPGSKVRVTGHFDDSASTTCRLVPRPGTFQYVQPAPATIARCRGTFVAEAVHLLPS
jgi:hypothetical protein